MLPVRFDDTPIKGEIPTVKYLNIKGMKPEELGERIIKKVVGSDKYTAKKETKVVTVSNKANIATPQVLLDINWGMRGFNYEWRPRDGFFELEPEQEKELTFPLSDEKVFLNEFPELNIFAEYKDLENRHCDDKLSTRISERI